VLIWAASLMNIDFSDDLPHVLSVLYCCND